MIPLRLLGPFAFGYFLSYLFRVVNAVAGPGIAADLHIDPAALGFLTSVYFLSFALVQLPLGVALDRYGPARVEAVLLLFAAAGALLFSIGGNLLLLTIGRALIGVGVAAGLMAAFKAYALVLPAGKLPLANGIHMAIGGLGVLAGGLPSELAMNLIGWRGLFLGLAILSLLSAAILFLVVPKLERPASSPSLSDQIRAAGTILRDPAFLRIAPFATMSQTTVFALQSLWAGPWLRDVAGRSPQDAATVLSYMAVATIAGYLVTGAIGNHAARRGIGITLPALVGSSLFVLFQIAIIFVDPGYSFIFWLGFALTGTLSMLAYPALTGVFPPTLAGRVNAALNFVVFVAAFLGQWAVGVVVAFLTPRIGLPAAYQVAFGGLCVLETLAIVWYLGFRPQKA